MIHHPQNRGYGGALISGFSAAVNEWIFYTDGDGQFDPAELELDWTAPAVEVHRRVRVGGAWTTHQGKRLKVWRTHVPPVGDGPAVQASDGPVELLEVQPEGKARMAATDWAHGARWQPSDGLGT